MAVGANSYCDASLVASLVPRYADTNNAFTTSTRPTLVQVEKYIDEVSGILNTMLSSAGFQVPITQEDIKLALSFFVSEEVAAICEGINGSGRFGPTANSPAKSRFNEVMKDTASFVKMNAVGFERLGAIRLFSETSGIGFRDTSASGKATFPLFQRDDFGPDGFFKDDDK